MLDDDAALAVEWHAERREQRARLIPCRPHHGIGGDPPPGSFDGVGMDHGDERVLAHLHAEAAEIGLGAVRQFRRIRRQDSRAPFEENYRRLARVDVTEVAGERKAADLRQCTRHFDAGRPAAHDDEGEQLLAPLHVGFAFRVLEGEEDATPHLERVLEALEPRGQRFPLAPPEVGVPGTGRNRAIVVRHAGAVGETRAPSRDVNPFDIAEHDFDVALTAQDRADW